MGYGQLASALAKDLHILKRKKVIRIDYSSQGVKVNHRTCDVAEVEGFGGCGTGNVALIEGMRDLC